MGELAVFGHVWVRVGFEEPGRAVFGQAEVDACIPAEFEGAIDTAGEAIDLRDELGRQRWIGGTDGQASFFGAAPLGAVGDDPWRTGTEAIEEEFPRREGVQALMPEDADVDLATFDVLLDDRVGFEGAARPGC